MDQLDKHALQMISEISGVYDVVGILETLAFLAPQGVTFEQVLRALMSLQPKAA